MPLNIYVCVCAYIYIYTILNINGMMSSKIGLYVKEFLQIQMGAYKHPYILENILLLLEFASIFASFQVPSCGFGQR